MIRGSAFVGPEPLTGGAAPARIGARLRPRPGWLVRGWLPTRRADAVGRDRAARAHVQSPQRAVPRATPLQSRASGRAIETERWHGLVVVAAITRAPPGRVLASDPGRPHATPARLGWRWPSRYIRACAQR